MNVGEKFRKERKNLQDRIDKIFFCVLFYLISVSIVRDNSIERWPLYGSHHGVALATRSLIVVKAVVAHSEVEQPDI